MNRGKIAGIIVGLLCLLIAWDFHNYHQKGRNLLDVGPQAAATNSVLSYSLTPESLAVVCDPQQDAHIVLPFSAKTFFWKRLHLEIDQLEGIRKVVLYYKQKGDRGFAADQRLTPKIFDSRSGKIFNWLLPPGDYSEIRLDFDGFASTGQVRVQELRLYDLSYFFYCQAILYLPLVFVVLAMLVLPGSILHALVADATTAGSSNLVYFFTYSLCFYVVLYLVLVLALEVGLPATALVPTAFVVLSAILLFLLAIRKRGPVLREMLRSERHVFFAAMVLMLVCTFFVVQFSPSPFSYQSVNHNTIDEEVLFSKFSGHDNKFQYINGKAIAEDVPFATYYDDLQLVYQVQDRGILPGVVYAVFRTLFSSASSVVGESYLTYTLVGLGMNIMVIFPLIVLFRRYFPHRYQYLFLLVFCLNTYVLPNFYFTWFKFCGAALFVSGVVVLLEGRGRASGWLFAGLMFGLASSMHAGNALAIPLMFLWFVAMNMAQHGLLCRQTLLFPAGLLVLFVVVNLPWTVVKAIYYPDTQALIRQHYLPGTDKTAGLLTNLKSFLQTHSVSEQLRFRTQNLVDSLRFKEFAYCAQFLGEKRFGAFVRVVNNYQFLLVMFSVLPLVLIGLTAGAVQRVHGRCRQRAGTVQGAMDQARREMLVLLTLSVATIVGLIFLAYVEAADINHKLPAGAILIVHTLLIGSILGQGTTGRVLLMVYALFSAWRIALHTYLFIF